jgi:predicted pyridoxine 5'-phosphate oxidase superfamily flavin-nucleotide-binding protein
LQNGVYFKASGPQTKSLANALLTSAKRNRIPLERALEEEVPQRSPAFFEYDTLRELRTRFAGIESGASAYEYLSTEHRNLIGIIAEIPVFTATEIDDSLHNLSKAEAQHKEETLLGNLPRLIKRAGEIASRLPSTDPLVIAGMAVTGKLGSVWVEPPKDPSELQRSLTPDDAFILVVRSAFFQACKAGMVIRMLKKYDQGNDLQERMTREVRRIVQTVEQLGVVKAIPVADAVRLQIDAATIALDHSVKLSQSNAKGISQGPITRFRARMAERKAAKIQIRGH